jgi:hypothetical protein
MRRLGASSGKRRLRTAGIAPHLEDGVEYVNNLRRADAERLAEIER